ncbi:DUF2382 domain-containing protein [Angustibacter aerolatus]
MINHEQADRLKGATVYSSTGDKIGKAGDIYLDDQTGDVAWATVNTGLFGTNESFVPLREANLQDDGGDARIDVPFTKDKIKDAPNVAADGHLSPEEERELYTYYGMSDAFDSTAGVSGDANVGGEGYAAGNGYAAGQGQGLDDRNEHGTEGHDTSGPTTDDAMTRSEQHLNVGTERVAAGKARLRKYVTTEQQTVTVPVTREEVRLEREPITDANRGNATAGPELSEEEHEVTLTEERVTVNKETVPVERVRLGTEEVTEQRTVTEDVSQEHIDLDSDTEATTNRGRE